MPTAASYSLGAGRPVSALNSRLAPAPVKPTSPRFSIGCAGYRLLAWLTETSPRGGPHEQEDEEAQAAGPPQQGQPRQEAPRRPLELAATRSARRRRRRASGRPSRRRRGGASCTTPSTRSAIVVRRQLGAPRLVGAGERAVDAARRAVLARGHGARVRAGGSRCSGTRARRRRSPRPRRARVISAAGRAEPVATARSLHRLEHARARERLQVLGEIRRRARRGTRRAAPRAAPRRAAAPRATCTRARPTPRRRTASYTRIVTYPRFRRRTGRYHARADGDRRRSRAPPRCRAAQAARRRRSSG